MLDPASLIPGAPGAADFSTLVCYRHWTFGFVAYRTETCVLLGDEMRWVHLPSWLTALCFVLLAFAEWLVFRFLTRQIRRWWSRRTLSTDLGRS